MEFERDSVKCVYKDKLWSATVNRPFFQITEMPLTGSPSSWKVENRYISNAKGYVDKDKIFYFFIPQLQKICYEG